MSHYLTSMELAAYFSGSTKDIPTSLDLHKEYLGGGYFFTTRDGVKNFVVEGYTEIRKALKVKDLIDSVSKVVVENMESGPLSGLPGLRDFDGEGETLIDTETALSFLREVYERLNKYNLQRDELDRFARLCRQVCVYIEAYISSVTHWVNDPDSCSDSEFGKQISKRNRYIEVILQSANMDRQILTNTAKDLAKRSQTECSSSIHLLLRAESSLRLLIQKSISEDDSLNRKQANPGNVVTFADRI